MLLGVDLPSRPRRPDRELSPPSGCFIAPADSAYGSGPATPATLAEPEDNGGSPITPVSYYGTQSDSDDPFTEGDPKDVHVVEAGHDAECCSRIMSATLPIRSSCPRPRLASSFYSGNGSRFQRPDLTAEFTRLRIGSLRRPDRFIPARPREAELTERFRTGKAAHELTAFEKLLRNNMATEDPFRYRRRAVLPMSAQLRLQSRSEATGSRNRGMYQQVRSSCAVLV
jgi:hypothetical protein